MWTWPWEPGQQRAPGTRVSQHCSEVPWPSPARGARRRGPSGPSQAILGLCAHSNTLPRKNPSYILVTWAVEKHDKKPGSRYITFQVLLDSPASSP